MGEERERNGLECLVKGDSFSGVKREGPVEKHSGRKIAHDRFCLDVKVSEHLVRAPAAQELNDVCVNLGTEESHGARCAERSSRNVCGKKTKLRAEKSAGPFEGGCNVTRSDWFKPVMAGIPIGGQRGGWRSIVLPEVNNAACKAEGGGELWVAAVGETHHFATDTILLGGKREGGKCGTQEGRVGGGGEVESNRTLKQLNIGEREGSGIRLGTSIFAWAKKEEKSNSDHISNGDGKN